MEANSPSRRRLLGTLLVLLSSLLATASSVNWKDCDGINMICSVHGSCTADEDSNYAPFRTIKTLLDKSCSRYILLRAKSKQTIEIDIRESSITRAVGFQVFPNIGNEPVWSCVDNVANSTTYDVESEPDASSQLHCKFDMTLRGNKDGNILTVLAMQMPWELKKPQAAIEFSTITNLYLPCEWNSPLFTNANQVNVSWETPHDLMTKLPKKICPSGYVNKYKESSDDSWKVIGDFRCDQGVVKYVPEGTEEPRVADLATGMTKCSRKNCETCSCPWCLEKGNNASRPYLKSSEGELHCYRLRCPMYMVVRPKGAPYYITTLLFCSARSTPTASLWNREDMENEAAPVEDVTCMDVVLCTVLQPITTKCPETVDSGYDCYLADIKNDGRDVCTRGDRTMLLEKKGGNSSQVEDGFHCDQKSGRWLTSLIPMRYVNPAPGGVFYCLRKQSTEAPAPEKPKEDGLSLNTKIYIAVGFCIAAVVIFTAAWYCKKQKDKKEDKALALFKSSEEYVSKRPPQAGSSTESLSKSSIHSLPPEDPSPETPPKNGKDNNSSDPGSGSAPPAPPPPPPPPPPKEQPGSSGGSEKKSKARQPKSKKARKEQEEQPAAGEPPAGPDTGKPDKPAQLVDISNASKSDKKPEKKADQESDGAMSQTGPATGPDGTNKSKNNKKSKKSKKRESARSQTARSKLNVTAPAAAEKKSAKRNSSKKSKSRKKKADDDNDLKLGGKGVKNDTSTSKPYTPPAANKFVNVTETEDDPNPPLFKQKKK